VGGPGLVKQRVAARLLVASCTLALGLGLGTAIAVSGVLALQHPRLTVRSPGSTEGRLDRGVHELFVSRTDPGGEPPLSTSQPACTVTEVGSGKPAAPAATDAGFAAVEVGRSGGQRVACTSAIPVTVLVAHVGEPFTAYLAAIGRGLLLAAVLTVLAVVWAAKALLAARRLGSSPSPDGAAQPPSRGK